MEHLLCAKAYTRYIHNVSLHSIPLLTPGSQVLVRAPRYRQGYRSSGRLYKHSHVANRCQTQYLSQTQQNLDPVLFFLHHTGSLSSDTRATWSLPLSLFLCPRRKPIGNFTHFDILPRHGLCCLSSLCSLQWAMSKSNMPVLTPFLPIPPPM